MSAPTNRRADLRFEGGLRAEIHFEDREGLPKGSATCLVQDVSFNGVRVSLPAPDDAAIAAIENREWLLKLQVRRGVEQLEVQGWARWVNAGDRAFSIGLQYNDQRSEHLRLVEWAHQQSNASLRRKTRVFGVTLCVVAAVLLAVVLSTTRANELVTTGNTAPRAQAEPTRSTGAQHETAAPPPITRESLAQPKDKGVVGDVPRELIEIAPPPQARPKAPADATRYNEVAGPAPPGFKAPDAVFYWVNPPSLHGQHVRGLLHYSGPPVKSLRVHLRDALAQDVDGCFLTLPIEAGRTSYDFACQAAEPFEAPLFPYYLPEP